MVVLPNGLDADSVDVKNAVDTSRDTWKQKYDPRHVFRDSNRRRDEVNDVLLRGNNLDHHKIGDDYEYIDEPEDNDIGEGDKNKRLQDLIDFVNGGNVASDNAEDRKTISLGARNKDINDLFDDVIETTPATDILGGDIEWGRKMWDEVEDDFGARRRQKVRVRKRKDPSERPRVRARPSPRTRTEEEAALLSVWAAAERVAEDAPSLRFDSGESAEPRTGDTAEYIMARFIVFPLEVPHHAAVPDTVLELDYLTPPGRRQGNEAPALYQPPAPRPPMFPSMLGEEGRCQNGKTN